MDMIIIIVVGKRGFVGAQDARIKASAVASCAQASTAGSEGSSDGSFLSTTG